jgi:hypothetical protein
MAERVMPADRDAGELGVDRVNESSGGRISRPMMTDLHDIGTEIVAASEQPSFTRFARVAHEELAKSLGAEHDNDTVLVHVVTGIGEKRHRWREDVERYAVSGHPAHPAPGENDRYAMRMGRGHSVSVCVPVVGLPRVEDHSDRHRINDRRGRTYMIAVGNSLTSLAGGTVSALIRASTD